MVSARTLGIQIVEWRTRTGQSAGIGHLGAGIRATEMDPDPTTGPVIATKYLCSKESITVLGNFGFCLHAPPVPHESSGSTLQVHHGIQPPFTYSFV